MKEIIIDDLRRKIKELIVIIIISTLFVLLQVAAFPLLVEQMKAMESLLSAFPPELIKVMNISMDTVSSFDAYIAMKHFSSTWIIFLLLIALPAATILNKEKSNGTIELLLSQPISRVKLSTAKYFSGLIQVYIFVAPSILLTIPLTLIWNIQSTPIHYVYFTIMSLCFSSVVYSATFFLGSIFKEPSKSYMIAIMAIVGFYTLTAISALVKDLENLKYFSAFFYYDGNIPFMKGEVEIIGSITFILLSVIFTVSGIYIFNKRDVL
jgi:ABC-2 type transport system permease protein